MRIRRSRAARRSLAGAPLSRKAGKAVLRPREAQNGLDGAPGDNTLREALRRPPRIATAALMQARRAFGRANAKALLSSGDQGRLARPVPSRSGRGPDCDFASDAGCAHDALAGGRRLSSVNSFPRPRAPKGQEVAASAILAKHRDANYHSAPRNGGARSSQSSRRRPPLSACFTPRGTRQPHSGRQRRSGRASAPPFCLGSWRSRTLTSRPQASTLACLRRRE